MRYLLAAMLVSCSVPSSLPDDTMVRCDCVGIEVYGCDACVETDCEAWCHDGTVPGFRRDDADASGSFYCGERPLAAPDFAAEVSCYRPR